MVDRYISVEDVEGAIASFSPCKSLELDSLALEWYGTFSDFVAPRLLQVFNSVREEGSLPSSI